MVFVSLEAFVGSSHYHQQQHVTPSTYHTHGLAVSTHASVHVVVTPGSSAMKHANASVVSTRSRFGLRASHKAATAASTPFVLYVTDSTADVKYVLTKSAAEYYELRERIAQSISAAACSGFSCCGSLSRIAQSPPLPLAKSLRRAATLPATKWIDRSVASQSSLASSIQAFVNDVLHVVTTREQQCATTTRADTMLEQFLDLRAHRAAAAASAAAATGSTTSTPTHSLPQTSHNIRSNDTECPICCVDLRCDAMLALPCRHTFHAACVRVWFSMQHTCPVCRLMVPADAAVASTSPA